jgi:hypothetical protein
MDTRLLFRANDKINRAEMAKVISLYAQYFTLNKGLQPLAREEIECSTFTDLDQTNSELQSYITQACELGLMGYYSDGKQIKPAFEPNANITLAEVATTVSRLLRGEAHKGSEKRWYHNHLLALQKANIMAKGVDPMKKALRREVYEILRNIK